MNARGTRTRRHSQLRLGLFAVSSVLLVAPIAQGAPLSATPSPDARSVVVSPPLCKIDALPLAHFLDCLRVELAGRGFACCRLADPADEMATVTSLHVKVEIDPCVADANQLQISVREAVGPRLAERHVSIADVPEAARPRALALAVAELIRSLEQEPPAAVAEPIHVPAKNPSPPSVPSAAAQPIALALHVEAEVRSSPTRDTTMWGGRIGLTANRRILHADLDLGGSTVRAGTELGDVLLCSASVGLGVGPRIANRFGILDLGLRAELGWVWMHGETALAKVRTGAGGKLISSLGFRISLEAPGQLRVRPTLSLESGAMLRGAKGDVEGAPSPGMTGYYLLAALGIAVSL
jgi:hypothetical protein